MSQQITESFVKGFGSAVFHLAQQKGSTLRGTVREESQHSKIQMYDRIGQVSAVKKSGRHMNTPQLDTPHSRRAVSLVDYVWADLVDSADKLRTLNDPTNDYVMAAMWSLGRSMDDEIIAALGGTAYSGEEGTTPIVMPSSQKYASNNGVSFVNLNVRTLRALNRKFMDADVPKDELKYLLCAPSQVESMLGQTEATSSDYASVKALVQGDIDTFMGFKFIQSTRLAAQVDALSAQAATGVVGSGSSVIGFRKAYAYAKQGALLSIGQDPKSQIGPRADKNYSMQAYAEMAVGAVRMEEVKVIEVLCTEA